MPDSPLGDQPPIPAQRVPALSPAAREEAIAQLTEGFAQDHLTLEEFEHRVAAAYAARSSTELETLTHDLVSAAARHAVATAVAPTSTQLSAVFSSMERGGIVEVPQRLILRAIAGNIELDLSHARFAPGVTEIVVRAFMGNVELKLPPGVQVENQGSAFLGSFEAHVSGFTSTRRGRSIVRLVGRVVMSSVSVTN
jgi:hypothetical protein